LLPNKKNIVKENSEYLKNIPFVEMNVSKLINYSTGTMRKVFFFFFSFNVCGAFKKMEHFKKWK
jgi:hypothetical protein